MIKIGHVEDAKRLQSLPQEVVTVVKGIAEILDNEYGEDRNVECGDGGYILVIQSAEEMEQLEEIFIDIDEILPEYVERIEVQDGENYTNSLVLLNNEFSVSLIIPEAVTPTRFLEEIF